MTVDKLIKDIEELFETDITDYRISKDTGITLSVIQNYRNGKYALENMTLKIAKKLYEYKEKINMTNYGKMMVIVNELVLEEGAFVSYWSEDNFNDITTVYSVDELKAHLGNLNDEDFENIVIQVNFDNQEKDYQITLNDFDAVYNKNEFIMNLLHNTR
ncbi:hypothetical protein [Gemella sanguinis]|jgi:hypothetical protein|uniref:hypothetical protein n=1 Tax=Gemella sanguinis TaxID=84135 RepID=UPI00205D39F0|nr:hypothetical protein [Gemella sanguinis]DAO12124.1 MAG TPA: hypothetical protein [Caudoviricetes sp.]DAU05066.1 MAG TPA: hypothetical protein [Caudoviricetes sp.]